MKETSFSMKRERFNYLFQAYINKTYSEAEREEFLYLASLPDYQAELQQLSSLITIPENKAPEVDPEVAEYILQSILPLKEGESVHADKPVISFFRSLGRWQWAALFFLTIGVAAALFLIGDRKNIKETERELVSKNDSSILPGTTRAILTLGDGSSIVLDSIANGTVAQQGSASVIKKAGGELMYSAPQGDEAVINKMTTPRGGLYNLTLSDGTKVWLNAASSIEFPSKFSKLKRMVKITGEAYFEVARNQAAPFIVNIDGRSTIQVLGTTFNINSYVAEGEIRTTLIEGSVKVNEQLVLHPGEQSIQSFAADSLSKPGVKVANIEQALAWRNGLFNFDGLNLEQVMRQIERWYNIDVTYQGSVPNIRFGGKMSNDVDLNGLMIGLKASGVHFKIEDRKLIILP